MTSIIIRCEKCGKVLKGKVQKTNIVINCPRCKDTFVIPEPSAREARKYKRSLIPESRYCTPLPESLTKVSNTVNYRVTYTEVPPMDYVLKRSDRVPLLDISEGGMGFIIRAENKSQKVLPGDILIVEIDFPIFVQPVYTKVEVCWLRPLKEVKMMHVGVRFYKPGEELKKVLKGILKYLASKSQTLEFETWGSF